jgi:sugar phosphate isomerase/epimerase
LELVLWAGCVWRRDLLERAEALEEGGFSSMSVFMKDLFEWEERGRTVAELRSELDARGAPVSALDPYIGWHPAFDPGAVTGERAAFLGATEDDVLRFADATGATWVSLVAPYAGPDADFAAVADSLGRFADRAAGAGLRPQLEIVPRTKLADVATAVRLVTAVGRPNVGVLLDTYNLSRCGTDPRELDDVPHELIFGMQLADAALEPPDGDAARESLHARLPPGEGELPVAELVRRVLRGGPLPPVGPEVFHDELAALPAAEAARRCGDAARSFLAAL